MPGRRTALILLALPAALPVLAAVGSLLAPSEHWPHLLKVVLPDVVVNTLLLVLLVAAASALLGSGLAWLTARYLFPGVSLLHAALLLPLAMPGYVLGFVFIHLFDYAGPLQSLWRDLSGAEGALWQVRSLPAVAVVLTLTLYPYVYLIARNAFVSIGADMLEVAATLGQTRPYRRIALPLARPWIAGGMLLVAMEVLADFGTVALFNVDTFTTAIYKSWFGLFSLDAALQLASFLVLAALLLMAAQQRLQSRGRWQQDMSRPLPRIPLHGLRAWSASLGLVAFVALVAGVPLLLPGQWSLQHLQRELDPRYTQWLFNSLSLALAAAVLITAAALLLAYLERGSRGRLPHWLARGATLGYALPGTLIAVGLFAPLAALEKQLAPWLAPGWVTQSLLLVFIGYWARFLTVAYTPIAQQMQRITPALEEVSRGLGASGGRLLWHVHRPLLSGALATAATLVVIDVIKEMPITLMTRPLGWDTLATRVFELTAEGEYRRAALPALTIVLAGLLPVALLLRLGERRRASQLAEGMAHAA